MATTAYYFVNEDWSAIVPAGSSEARFGVQGKDAKRYGLDKLPGFDGELPDDAEPEVLTSANLTPEPEPEAVVASEPAPEPEAVPDEPAVKEAPTPANKAARKPATKGAARKDPVDGDSN